ncbi:exodeoxyribonuclease III [Polluticoccus soli]|uniref:exodeoxyribonuclease III n=1 Tax=Polluticoccus soli TaxID=3034150 RepID=UPI0023E19F91|nr:exodeoxyribonuclease III [Flavipsychrobacter sp. JY13-12]
MRIITYNINGIRSAIKKGFIDWLKTDPADIICLQEIKAEKENVDFAAIEALGFDTYWFSAEKKGYSGVAIFSKRRADNVFYGNGIMQSDAEGRVLRADFGDVTLVNAYYPSGTSGEIRQTYKYQWLDEFFEYLEELRKVRPKLIIVGDYNIAHKSIDIHNPVGNKKTSGFLPEERAWMDKFYENGYVDTFRVFNENPHHYTWWSSRFPTVREQNKGWRIDYISVTEPLRSALKGAAIHPDVKHSDHCPAFVEIDF